MDTGFYWRMVANQTPRSVRRQWHSRHVSHRSGGPDYRQGPPGRRDEGGRREGARSRGEGERKLNRQAEGKATDWEGRVEACDWRVGICTSNVRLPMSKYSRLGFVKFFCLNLARGPGIDARAPDAQRGAMRDRTSLGDFLDAQTPAALEWLQRMVAINSFTANREGVNRLGRLTAECFAPLGFRAEFVPSVNPNYGDHLVLERLGRSARAIALVSHLDTVFPPEEEARNNFHWLAEGTRIYGPGTHDIKGGTVMMWLVLRALQAHRPSVFEEITWKLLWNSSEETLSQDFGEVCRSRFDRNT